MQCGGPTCNAADNNGNLRKQETGIPNAASWYQQYDYDNLNRLQRVDEYTGNTSLDWQQEYVYDRWGNRTIHQTSTWGPATGPAINKKNFTVNTANNRLGVSGGPGVMSYDNAGNLTADTYSSAAVTRVYDAENRMTSETEANNFVAGVYTYNADGQRVRRKTAVIGQPSVETWQVYGFDGELLAEYAPNAGSAPPQKEYGYRNGQLLITGQSSGGGTPVNLALNKAATQSSDLAGGVASRAVDGNTSGTWANGSVTHTNYDGQAWWQVDLGWLQSVQSVEVWNRTDCCGERLTNFNVMLLDSNLAVIANTNVSGQAGTPTTVPISGTARYVKVQLAGTDYLSLGEVKVWGVAAAAPANLALNKPATQSSDLAGGVASRAVDGNTNGTWANGSVTHTNYEAGAWWQVDLGGMQAVQGVEVWNRTDCCGERLTNFNVMLLDSNQAIIASVNMAGAGGTPTTVPISGTARYVKVQLVGTDYLSVAEVKVWGASGGGGSSTQIQWLVADQLGTPRMIIDKTGALANVMRHDYLPFGEELIAGQGSRTTGQGYGADNVRQKFTSKERDIETGLDYFGARYYASTQGRFTSVDPGPFVVADPQSWNRYGYVQNNPLKFTDPTGRTLSLNGEAADDFVDYLERRSGLSLVRDAKTGKVTVAKGSKRNEKGTSKEFANLLKDIIGDSAKVGFTVKNDAGSGILFDDGNAAEKSKGASGIVDLGDIQNADAQSSELATTVVGHFLYEGLKLAQGSPFTGDIRNGLSGPEAGAHVNALVFEGKIMSGFTGQKEKLAERRAVDYGTTGVINFIYTSVQYDVTFKTQTASNPNSVTVDKISKTKPTRAPQYPPGP
jgi:RHS repeat-associated protein